MPVDTRPWFQDPGSLPSRTPNATVGAMKGSDILKIAAEIQARIASGEPTMNLTIGDFDPSIFPIPDALRDAIAGALADGQTNYPPAIGVPELRTAIRSFYRDRLGVDYPEGSVQVGAGARPPIYAAFRALVEPGDLVVYPVPSWNIRFYVQMNQGEHAILTTRPEDGFMPTPEDVAPHLSRARILVLNSPLNPAGTVIDDELLRALSQMVVDENRRREQTGERALYLLFDQVYWQLTFGREHRSPVALVPEMARYTIHIDAISKCWAGTGLRVGWAVLPPWLRGNVQPLVGHMGAWAGRAEQIATGKLLADPSLVDPWLDTFKGRVEGLLTQLADGFGAMAQEGLPVRSLAPEGAIYLSVHFDLIGRAGFATDEDLRAWLLREAGVGVVPFTAFGLPDGSGWVRFSVGTATPDTVSTALTNIRRALRAL